MDAARKPPFEEVAGVRLVRFHAEGGTSEVWYGEHKITGNPRAVKILHAEFCEVDHTSDSQRERCQRIRTRFVREGEALMEYPYPQMARGYGLYREASTRRLCTIMEFLEGTELQELIDSKGRLEVPIAIRIFDQIVDAVAHMHDDGRLHRDLKCGNAILLGRDPETFRVKLIDLGLVGFTSEGASKLTDDLGIDYTSEFAPLEQILQKPDSFHDPRTDVYALGVILFHMLTGKFPRSEWPTDRRLSAEARRSQREQFEASCRAPQQTRKLAPHVPLEVDELIQRCLTFDPGQRIATARHLHNALAPIRRQFWTRCVCGCDARRGRNRCPRCGTRITDEGVVMVPGPARIVRTPMVFAWVMHAGALALGLALLAVAEPAHWFGSLSFAAPDALRLGFAAGLVVAWWAAAYLWLMLPARSVATDAKSAAEPAVAPLRPTPPPAAEAPPPRPKPATRKTPPPEGGGAARPRTAPMLVCDGGRRIPVTAPQLRLGRDHAVVKELRDPGLGRLHAVIHVAPDTLEVEDQGEAAGIYVNGKRIAPRARQELQDGDRLTIGASVEFVVEA